MKLKELPLSTFHTFRLRYSQSILNSKDNKLLPVIVSLTSIPSRLSSLDIVIRSLLAQSSPPQLIVLWLNHSLKEKIPPRLKKLTHDTFKINYCEGTSSFRKLLPTIKSYQDSIVVTCDDDMIYPSNWLENLYNCHLEHPDCVVSQVGRLIKRNENGEIDMYKNWPFIRDKLTQKNFMPIGYGGVLYPVNIFDDRVFDSSLYMQLSPRADDLWFKAMAYLNGKTTYCASEKARPIPILKSQKFSLNSSNINADENRSQWQALCNYFPELNELGFYCNNE